MDLSRSPPLPTNTRQAVVTDIFLPPQMGDAYHSSNVASASSANSLARYTFAAAFPFFSIQMYTALGTGWASSFVKRQLEL